MERHGAYFVNEEQAAALGRTLFGGGQLINPKMVGKTPQQLAAAAKISVPAWARTLVAPLHKVGPEEPLSAEKLTTVLGWYEVDDWHAGCERCIEMLKYGGDGHSLVIHSRDEAVILAFGIEKPAFRIVVNTWGSLGAIGATTGVMPSMTLAPGGSGERVFLLGYAESPDAAKTLATLAAAMPAGERLATARAAWDARRRIPGRNLSRRDRTDRAKSPTRFANEVRALGFPALQLCQH